MKNPFLLSVLMVVLGSVSASQVMAQTFTTLYSFSGGSDGATPYRALLLSTNTLFGTTLSGGDSGAGVVFSLNTDGTGFVTLHSFDISSDGSSAAGTLVLSGSKIFGADGNGGTYNDGTVFALGTDSTGFQVLHAFTANIAGVNSDGGNPTSDLIISGSTLFGATGVGGSSNGGTIFKVNIDSTGFMTPYSFSSKTDGTAADDLVLSGNTLYGAAFYGGSSGNGTIFKVNTDGSGFTVLHTFTGGNDGANPWGLVLSGPRLYGTAYPPSGNGTVFAINTDGTGFATLHRYSGGSDGGGPSRHPILISGVLYGTTQNGGNSGSGTIFAVSTNGTAFTNLYTFSALSSGINSDGAHPHGGLVAANGILYGTASAGGTSGYGTVFSISLPSITSPQLTISPSDVAAVVLTWPTNYSGFTLQSTANLGPSAIWTTNLPPPVVVNGQNTITNPISGTQQFFRLSQ